MRIEHAFQEERDILAHALHVSLNWRGYIYQVVGFVGAVLLFNLFQEIGVAAGLTYDQPNIPMMKNPWYYIFTVLGAGLGYCWLSAANSAVVKIADERMLGHLGVGHVLVQRFLTKSAVAVVLLPAVCYGIALTATLLLCIFGAVGEVEHAGNFLLAVLILPIFLIALAGFVATYVGLFVLPALTGGESTSPRETVSEILSVARWSPHRMLLRHASAILGSLVIAAPFCFVAQGALFLIDWAMAQVVGPGASLLGYVQSFEGFLPSLLANSALGIVAAFVFALPISFLSTASLLIHRAAQETIDESREAYLE